MKISNSKKQLAKLLIEAGVTQFPDGANWAAQDKDKSPIESSPLSVMFYSTKPLRPQKGDGYWFATVPLSELVGKPVKLSTLIPNWHQTALSRDEFDQIVAKTIAQSEPDADGWIEWKGGECPLRGGIDGLSIEYRTASGDIEVATEWDILELGWIHQGTYDDVEAYRVVSEPDAPANQTIEQLAIDYRNRKDYAERKQQEADDAKADAEAKLAELVAAGKALGLVLSVTEQEQEQEKPAKPYTGKFYNDSTDKRNFQTLCDGCGKRYGLHYGDRCESGGSDA